MRRVFRSKEQAIGIALFALIGSSLAVAEALTIDGTAVSTLERVLWVTLGLAWGAFSLLRGARAGVYVIPEGVKILNPLRTTFVPWSRLARFTLRRWGPFPLMGHAVLTDDSSVHIFGIEAPNPLTRSRNQSAQKLIADLNAVRELAQSGGPGRE
jgi:hypothetical protein